MVTYVVQVGGFSLFIGFILKVVLTVVGVLSVFVIMFLWWIVRDIFLAVKNKIFPNKKQEVVG